MDATAPVLDQDVLDPVLVELQARRGDAPGVALHDEPYRFDPTDWYWLRRDGALFASARIATVAPGDAYYLAWRATGRSPTPYPLDEAGNESVDALQTVLDASGGHASLGHYAGALRYAAEVAGIDLNGVSVATDRTSQAMVANAFAYLSASGAASVSYKTPAGFVSLSADQVKAMAVAVGAHVQACFALEDQVEAAIAKGTVATKAEVDVAFAPPA